MNRVSAALKRGMLHVLDTQLPRRTKRLIFLASFSARMKNEKQFDSATLEKLNRLMVLSSNDSALKLPIHLSKVIWNGRTINDICGDSFADGQLSSDRVAIAAEQIVNRMPNFLRYGRRNDIVADVKKLLSNRFEVLAN
jgi:hypothetical protein